MSTRSSRADEAVQRSLQRRQQAARAEVASLIDAGRELFGSGASPRVADIVRAAGVSIEAFYRYFGSKDEFIAAVAEDGSDRVTMYVARKMAEVDEPGARLRAAVEALMSQAARPELASAARNILGRVSSDGGPFESALAELLSPTLADLGASDVDRDARIAATALVAVLQRFLWSQNVPSDADTDHLCRFVRRAVSP